MKKVRHIFGMLVVGFSMTCWSQLVPNGSFENGSLPSDSGQRGSTLDPNTALPNWSISNAPLFYYYGPLGGPVIAIGDFSAPSSGTNAVFLQAGFGGAKTPVYMWQNLSISALTKSITFQTKPLNNPGLWPQGYYLALLVSTAGISITPTLLFSDVSGYSTYGIDVTPYANSSVELRFSIDPLGSNRGGAWVIDNVRFSPSAVPEPCTLALFSMGGAMLSLRLFRKK